MGSEDNEKMNKEQKDRLNKMFDELAEKSTCGSGCMINKECPKDSALNYGWDGAVKYCKQQFKKWFVEVDSEN